MASNQNVQVVGEDIVLANQSTTGVQTQWDVVVPEVLKFVGTDKNAVSIMKTLGRRVNLALKQHGHVRLVSPDGSQRKIIISRGDTDMGDDGTVITLKRFSTAVLINLYRNFASQPVGNGDGSDIPSYAAANGCLSSAVDIASYGRMITSGTSNLPMLQSKYPDINKGECMKIMALYFAVCQRVSMNRSNGAVPPKFIDLLKPAWNAMMNQWKFNALTDRDFMATSAAMYAQLSESTGAPIQQYANAINGLQLMYQQTSSLVQQNKLLSGQQQNGGGQTGMPPLNPTASIFNPNRQP